MTKSKPLSGQATQAVESEEALSRQASLDNMPPLDIGQPALADTYPSTHILSQGSAGSGGPAEAGRSMVFSLAFSGKDQLSSLAQSEAPVTESSFLVVADESLLHNLKAHIDHEINGLSQIVGGAAAPIPGDMNRLSLEMLRWCRLQLDSDLSLVDAIETLAINEPLVLEMGSNPLAMTFLKNYEGNIRVKLSEKNPAHITTSRRTP